MRKIALILTLIIAACTAPKPNVAGGDAERPLTKAEHIAMDKAKKSGALVLVDKSDRRLTFYEGGKKRLVIDNIRFGDAPFGHKRQEGDERTPEGLYSIDARNPGSAYHLSLRIDYPNARDKAAAVEDGVSPGGDIFIHGQPNGYVGPTLPNDWTDGCIAVSNADIEKLWDAVPDGTPIYIRR
jgi:murein L,D-transpeptidase YafK